MPAKPGRLARWRAWCGRFVWLIILWSASVLALFAVSLLLRGLMSVIGLTLTA